MGETDFYKLFGLGRSASADQIRVAYRELVKKYHPDLFSAPSDKAKATEKLRLINEAYAVLGNPERRQRYDQEFVQKHRARPRAPASTTRSKAPRARRRQAEVRRKTFKMPKLRLRFSKKLAGYSLAAAMVILGLVYAGRSEPRLALAWTLWEKLEVSPPQRVSSTRETSQGWVRLGQHASVAECAAVLRTIVRDDERAGSRAVFDEKNGTMAITVHVKNEAAPKGEQHQFSAPDSAEKLATTGITKRVRNLECRATQRMEMESWFHKTLRGLGWVQ
jgi:DnaJ-domain-containing protein 1